MEKKTSHMDVFSFNKDGTIGNFYRFKELTVGCIRLGLLKDGRNEITGIGKDGLITAKVAYVKNCSLKNLTLKGSFFFKENVTLNNVKILRE